MYCCYFVCYTVSPRQGFSREVLGIYLIGERSQIRTNIIWTQHPTVFTIPASYSSSRCTLSLFGANLITGTNYFYTILSGNKFLKRTYQTLGTEAVFAVSPLLHFWWLGRICTCRRTWTSSGSLLPTKLNHIWWSRRDSNPQAEFISTPLLVISFWKELNKLFDCKN